MSKECCFAAAGAEPLSVERRLMAPGQECIEDIPSLLKYAEICGQQRQRLTEDSEFTRESLRFIKSVDELSLGYGVLPVPTAASNIPKLTLPKDTYFQLREVGMAVKILLGYLSLDTDAFLTPDATNVLVPHISCVVQTSPQGSPELRPIGFLRQQKDAPIIVLLSANQGAPNKRSITEFFNKIYRRDRLPKIHVIDAEEVSENYIPHVIKGWISQSYEPFTETYLANAVQEQIVSKYTYAPDPRKPEEKESKKDHRTPQQHFINAIHFTATILKLLLEKNFDEILAKRHDTICKLVADFWEGASPDVPEKGESAIFKTFVKNNKATLIKAAIQRIKSSTENLDESQRAELHSLLEYINVSMFPEENLPTLATCKTFWGKIKKLKLTCVNPDSPYGNKISVDARLRKYFSAGYSTSHTEQILIKYLSTNPCLLTNALESAVPDAGATEEFKPLFLGYVIDSFSWIDVCSNCASFLHSTDVWKDALQNTVPSLEKRGYRVIINPLDSVFRFVSQHAYDGAPLDLNSAGGGSDYLKRGWDFRFLSKERIALNTRSSLEDSIKTRDQTIERVQSRLMSKALSEPFDFWRANTVVWDLIINQSKTNEFFRNALIAVHLKHPDQKSVRLVLAYKEESNRLALLQSIVEEESEWSENEKPLLQSVYESSRNPYPLSRWPQKYSKVYYGGALLKKIDECLEPKDYSQVKSKLRRFARYCLVYFENDTHDKLDFNEAVTKIIQYWETFWQAGSKHDSWSTPEEVDKPNMTAIINLLWKLAYKKDYADILNSEERENLVVKLKCLTQPKWVKDLLAPKEKETKYADELDEAA